MNSVLTWVVARFGGAGSSGSDAIIRADGSSAVEIENATINESDWSCVAGGDAAAISISDSTLEDCDRHGVYVVNGVLSMTDTEVSSNGSHALNFVQASLGPNESGHASQPSKLEQHELPGMPSI